MIYLNGKDEVRAVEYKIFPKSRFTAAKVKVDGKDTDARVTCKDHKKFPAYTYWIQDGKILYVKGNFDGKTLTTKK